MRICASEGEAFGRISPSRPLLRTNPLYSKGKSAFVVHWRDSWKYCGTSCGCRSYFWLSAQCRSASALYFPQAILLSCNRSIQCASAHTRPSTAHNYFHCIPFADSPQSFLIQICTEIGHDRGREFDNYFERWM